MMTLAEKLRAVIEDPEIFPAFARLLGANDMLGQSRNVEADRRATLLLIRLMDPQHLDEFIANGYVTINGIELHATGRLRNKTEGLSCIALDSELFFPRMDVVLAYYIYLKENPERIKDILMRHKRVIGDGVHLAPETVHPVEWMILEDAPYVFVSTGVVAEVSGVPDYGVKALQTWCALTQMVVKPSEDGTPLRICGNGRHELPTMWYTVVPRLVAYRISEITGCSLEDAKTLMSSMEDPDGTINNPEHELLLRRISEFLHLPDQEPDLVRLRKLPDVMAGFRFRDIVNFYRMHPEEPAVLPSSSDPCCNDAMGQFLLGDGAFNFATSGTTNTNLFRMVTAATPLIERIGHGGDAA